MKLIIYSLLVIVLINIHGNASKRISDPSQNSSIYSSANSQEITKNDYKKIVILITLFKELELKYTQTAEGKQLVNKLSNAIKEIPQEFLGEMEEIKEVHNDYKQIENLTAEQKAGYWIGSLINGCVLMAESAESWMNPLTYVFGGARWVGSKFKNSAQVSMDIAKYEEILSTSQLVLERLSKDEDIQTAFNNLVKYQVKQMEQLSNSSNKNTQQDIDSGLYEMKKLYKLLILTMLNKYRKYFLDLLVFTEILQSIEAKAKGLRIPNNFNKDTWFSWEFFSHNISNSVFQNIEGNLNSPVDLNLKKLGLSGIENLKVSDFGHYSDLNILAMLGNTRYIQDAPINVSLVLQLAI